MFGYSATTADYLQPQTILVDEPELGLHYTDKALASLFGANLQKETGDCSQSVELLNEFDVEDIIVVDREENTSYVHRLEEEKLEEWLEEYSLGELWQKNLLGGRPGR